MEVEPCLDNELISQGVMEYGCIKQINIFQQTTTIFKEGQTVRQDVDYTHLHKQKLGHGTHGDVHRVWFYHLMKEVEADIVVKEVFEYSYCIYKMT